MKKIYSKINPKILLCSISRYEDIKNGRTNISPDNEFLQVATIKESKWKKFKAHYHLETNKEITKTQESWIIIEGAVVFWLYDIDNEKYKQFHLKRGDCIVTFHSGHSYEIVEDNTIVYEIKNGPYYGIEKDKAFI